MTTLRDIIRTATQQLRKAGIETPELDARLLVQHALGLSRDQLLTRGADTLTTEQLQHVAHLIDRRVAREPVSRILGTREFWSLEFRLSPATLDPRPDSETIVEAALAAFPDKQAPLRVLDLGTGTGCLLLAVLSELPNASGLGIDLAPLAVETAQENTRHLNLSHRAEFRVGNWAEGISDSFDLILSNPPYIPDSDIPALEPEVRQHDPYLALAGGSDGLNPYRIIAADAPRLLTSGGWIVLEVGAGQAADVSDLLVKAGLQARGARRDLGGIERAVVAQAP